jgi:hypothetical protein
MSYFLKITAMVCLSVFSFSASALCKAIVGFYDKNNIFTNGYDCTLFAQIKSPTKGENIKVWTNVYDKSTINFSVAKSDGTGKVIGDDREYFQVSRYHPKGSHNSVPMKPIPVALHVNVKSKDENDLFGDLQIDLKDDYTSETYWNDLLSDYSLYIRWEAYASVNNENNKSLFILETTRKGDAVVIYKLSDTTNSANSFYVSVDSTFVKSVSYPGFTSTIVNQKK